MTLIPDLQYQLADAARSRSARRRAARVIAAGGAAAALIAVLLALTIWQDDSGERRSDSRPTGGPLGLDIPAGRAPELRDLIAAFRREPTPRDDNGFTKADLDEIPDRQPGEDPTRSRRVDLPSGPVYLWPMTDGVCSSFAAASASRACSSWAGWQSGPATRRGRTAVRRNGRSTGSWSTASSRYASPSPAQRRSWSR